MSISTIRSEGRTTVPAHVRSLAAVGPGTRLVWSVMPDGTIIVRAEMRTGAAARSKSLARQRGKPKSTTLETFSTSAKAVQRRDTP